MAKYISVEMRMTTAGREIVLRMIRDKATLERKIKYSYSYVHIDTCTEDEECTCTRELTFIYKMC